MIDVYSHLGISEEMDRLEQYMRGLVNSRVFLLSQPSRYVLTSGGKRLRAVLVFLSSRVQAGRIPESAVYAAAAVELIHAASLVHDDLIDHAPHRRGQPTIHEKWHHDAALLVGDYLFALAARAITLTGNMRVMECLVEASEAICEGEISSVDTVEPLEAALESYAFKIARKTAALFEAAAKIGALCAQAAPEAVASLGRFGRTLGMAFQIVDDVLDYVGDAYALGKPAGGDLRRGLITLPLIYAVAYDDPDGFLSSVVDRFGDSLGPEELDKALRYVQRSSGPERARRDAERYRHEALQHLALVPDERARTDLGQVAQLMVERSS